MAMHKNFSIILPNYEIDHLCRVQDLLEAGVGEVLPIKVEKRNPLIHQVLWGVRKSVLQIYSITTVRVLSRLLKVKDSRYSLPNTNYTVT
jgi:hypothetical protein